jgi:hypothetical protein
MLENIEGAIKNGRSRKTGNIGYTRRRKTKQKHNAICVGGEGIKLWEKFLLSRGPCLWLSIT